MKTLGGSVVVKGWVRVNKIWSERALIFDLRPLNMLSRVILPSGKMKWKISRFSVEDKIIKKSEKLYHSSFKIF